MGFEVGFPFGRPWIIHLRPVLKPDPCVDMNRPAGTLPENPLLFGQ